MNNYFQYPEYAWSEPVSGYPASSGGWPDHRAGLRWGVPGWRLGELGGSKKPGDGTDWSTVVKVGLVVGGALAVYFIYRASKVAEPVAERLGDAGARLLMARVGGGAGSRGSNVGVARRSSGGRSVVVEPRDYKLLTA